MLLLISVPQVLMFLAEHALASLVLARVPRPCCQADLRRHFKDFLALPLLFNVLYWAYSLRYFFIYLKYVFILCLPQHIS